LGFSGIDVGLGLGMDLGMVLGLERGEIDRLGDGIGGRS